MLSRSRVLGREDVGDPLIALAEVLHEQAGLTLAGEGDGLSPVVIGIVTNVSGELESLGDFNVMFEVELPSCRL